MTLRRVGLTARPRYLAKGRDHASIAAAVADASGRVFLSAQSALAPDGTVRGLGDPAAQADATLDHIEAALAAAGADRCATSPS